MKVLVVDDDPDFQTFVSIALEEAGIEHVTADDAGNAVRLLADSPSQPFDLVLLDVEMPGPSGWELLMQIRESGDEVPVIFVSGLGRVEQRVKGLRLGADDYIVKPVEFEELLARMEAVIRRRQMMPPIEYGDLTLDLARRKVSRDGHAVYLSPKEFDLLLALVKADGAVVPRTDLLRDVWDIEFDPRTNLLDVYVGRLRKKLDRHGSPMIRTVRGKGFQALRRERV